MLAERSDNQQDLCVFSTTLGSCAKPAYFIGVSIHASCSSTLTLSAHFCTFSRNISSPALPWMVCRFTWVQLGFLGMVVCTWEAGRPSPAWSTLGSQRSQKWWARKRPTALAANHGLIFKFVAQDPRIRTHHSVEDKN